MASGTKGVAVSKSSLSSSLLIVFFLIVLISGAISEFFQAPSEQGKNIAGNDRVFDKGFFNNLQSMKFKNSIGVFNFKKILGPAGANWEMNSPRNLMAKAATIERIVAALEGIKVLKAHQKDSINISNYSLNSPLVELTMRHGGTSSKIRMGLVNPIDNSTYLTVDGKDFIYHIEKLNFSMVALSLYDFIDSTVFSFSPHDISKIKIYRGKRKWSTLGFSAALKEGEWVGRNGRTLDEEKIKEFLSGLSQVNSLFILDSTTPKLDKEIERYLANTSYTLEMVDRNENVYTYTVSHVVPKLHGIKMAKWKSFLISGSGSKYPYLVSKEKIKIFSFSESRINRLDIKEIQGIFD